MKNNEAFEEWFKKQPIGNKAYAELLSALSFEGKDIDVIIMGAFEAGQQEGYGEGKKDGLLNIPQIAQSDLIKLIFEDLDKWRSKSDGYGINYPDVTLAYEKIKAKYRK